MAIRAWWKRNQRTLWFGDVLITTLAFGYAVGAGIWWALPFLFVFQAVSVLGFAGAEP